MANESYWQSLYSKSEFELPAASKNHYDLIIMGGGLSGLSLAYWYEKKFSDQKVLVVEKKAIGSGASGQNAGFLTKGSFQYLHKLYKLFGLEKAFEIFRFAQQNIELITGEFDLKKTRDFQEQGSYTISSQFDSELLVIAKDHGFNFKLLDEPVFNPLGLKGKKIILDPSEKSINPLELCRSLVESLENTEILYDAIVEITEDPTFSLVTGNQTLTCNHLILGGFAPEIIFSSETWYQCKEELEFVKNEVLVTQPLKTKILGNYYDSDALGYFRQTADQRLIVGGYRQTTGGTLLEKFLNSFWTPSCMEERVEVSKEWVGQLVMSKDGLPIIKKLSKNNSIHLFTGFSGHGLGMIFHSAKELVSHL